MNDDICLWRQVNENWIKKQRVTSQAFKPTKKDCNKPSFDDGSLVTAEQSWIHFNKRFTSIGVVAVKVIECRQQGVEPVPDPLEDNPAHVIVDFGGLSKSKQQSVAQSLARKANTRGWKYTPNGLPSLSDMSS